MVMVVVVLVVVVVRESNRIWTVPDTDTIGISETINPTKKCLINNIVIII